MYAKMVGMARDVSDGSEDGAIVFKVRAAGGVSTPCSIEPGGLTIGEGGEEDTMIVFDGHQQHYRVGIDDGTDTLEIGHGTAHGTNTGLTINSSGDVIKIGQDSPSDAQVLTWDNSNTKVVWSDAAGGGGAYGSTTIICNTGGTTSYSPSAGDLDASGAILVDTGTTGGATTITLPSGCTDGAQFTVKDHVGNAATAKIIISPASGVNVDGANTDIEITQDWGSVTLLAYDDHFLIM